LPLALTLGDRGVTSWPVRRALAKLGLSHLLALSGWHLGVLLALWRPRRRRSGEGRALAVLLFWMVFLGPFPSLWRAGALVGCRLVALRMGRAASALSLTGTAAALLLIFRPGLSDSLGFVLSLSATLGVLLAYRWCLLSGWRRGWQIAVAVGWGAWFATLPWQVMGFQRVAWIGPVLTPWIAPVVAVLMVGSWTALLLDGAIPPLGRRAFDFLGDFSALAERALSFLAEIAPRPVRVSTMALPLLAIGWWAWSGGRRRVRLWLALASFLLSLALGAAGVGWGWDAFAGGFSFGAADTMGYSLARGEDHGTGVEALSGGRAGLGAGLQFPGHRGSGSTSRLPGRGGPPGDGQPEGGSHRDR
jgi:competence protein ComEC